jgi:hypothetical protein
VFRDELKKSFQLRREGEEGRDCLEKRTGEFLWVSVDDSLNVFFLETWETGGGWFHRGLFRFTYFSSFSEALVLISCEVHNKEVLILYCNSLPSTLLSESFSANPIASFFFPSWPLLSEADLGKKVEVLGVLMEAGKSVMGIGKCLTPARLPDRRN